MLRTGLQMMNRGATDDQIEKLFQTRFNIQWAWADSLATEIKQKFDQLQTARKNQIADISARIKSATKYCKQKIALLEKLFKKPVLKSKRNWILEQLLGIRSLIRRIANLNRKKQQLEGKKWLSVVFGSKKLFKAQSNLEANGYNNHQEWLEDWKKARSGNFYSVGKGSAAGGNPVARVLPQGGSQFVLEIVVPYFLREDYGEVVQLPFEVNERHLDALLWALHNNRPITVRCFRREHKDDQWYVELTTYIGMGKFMGRIGLNSGTAAAFVLARRVLKFSERLPKCLARPEDGAKHCWSAWNRVAKGIKGSKKYPRVRRHALFGWKRFPEVIPALFEKSKAPIK